MTVQVEEVGRKFSVEAPGVLVLEDAEGKERFELTSEEYQEVLEIVLDPTFVAAIESPPLAMEMCRPIADGGFTTIVVWVDLGTQATPSWGQCTDPEHPFERLVSLFVELLKKYYECPRVDLGTVQVRELCNGCWSYPMDWVGAC
jgi:hypothetical protein